MIEREKNRVKEKEREPTGEGMDSWQEDKSRNE